MTNEEFEKQKDFILSQQAQFSSDIIELKSGLTELRDIVARLANAALSRLEDTDQRISALVDSQMHLQEAQSRSSEEMNVKFSALLDSQIRLQETQRRTDENLNSLIDLVNRNLQGRNGGSTA